MNHYCLKSSSTLGPQSAQCSHSVVIVLPSAILHLTRCWALADHDDRLHEITARRLLKYPIQLSKLPFVPTKCLVSPPFYHCASTASSSHDERYRTGYKSCFPKSKFHGLLLMKKSHLSLVFMLTNSIFLSMTVHSSCTLHATYLSHA
jgi:hypothetical protein